MRSRCMRDGERKRLMADETDERVIITRAIVGVCHMQVCVASDVTDDEILAVCNSENPAGTLNGWSHICRENDEFWGKTEPNSCANYPGRMHYLVCC